MPKQKVGIGIAVAWYMRMATTVTVFEDFVTMVQQEIYIPPTQAIARRRADMISHLKNNCWMASLDCVDHALEYWDFSALGVDFYEIRFAVLVGKIVQLDCGYGGFAGLVIGGNSLVAISNHEIKAAAANGLLDKG